MFFPVDRKEDKSGCADFKQDLMKSQTLPRSNGAQAKRALFERMNTEPAKYVKHFPFTSTFIPDIQSTILSDGEWHLSEIDPRNPGLN